MHKKLIIVCGLVANLTACASQHSSVSAPQTTDMSASPADTIQMRAYTEPDGAFKFDYPRDWQDATDTYYGGSPGSKESLFEDKYGASCKVTVRNSVKNTYHPDNESVLHMLTDRPDKQDDLKSLYLKVDGKEIYEHVSKFQMFRRNEYSKFHSPVYAVFDFIILKDKDAYILTTKCLFEDYEKYLPIFERMGKSFEVYPHKK